MNDLWGKTRILRLARLALILLVLWALFLLHHSWAIEYVLPAYPFRGSWVFKWMPGQEAWWSRGIIVRILPKQEYHLQKYKNKCQSLLAEQGGKALASLLLIRKSKRWQWVSRACWRHPGLFHSWMVTPCSPLSSQECRAWHKFTILKWEEIYMVSQKPRRHNSGNSGGGVVHSIPMPNLSCPLRREAPVFFTPLSQYPVKYQMSVLPVLNVLLLGL